MAYIRIDIGELTDEVSKNLKEIEAKTKELRNAVDAFKYSLGTMKFMGISTAEAVEVSVVSDDEEK